MTQEEKQLLLKALCGYLPYGFKYQVQYGDTCIRTPEKVILDEEYTLFDGWQVHEIKPYLRPLSNMTFEERGFCLKRGTIGYDENDKIFDVYPYGLEKTMEVIDFLNAHHFDYRGLIEKGLALEALDGMYKID